MRQAFHILKKDIRHLGFEITAAPALLVLSAVVDWRENTDIAVLLLLPFFLVSASMIIRLIHAEAIPGDRQFWVTRPYRWTSLIAAKGLFLFLFLILPISLVRLVFLSIMGFPLTAFLPRLLGSAVFLIVPIGVLVVVAAVTSGFRPILLIFVALNVLQVPLNAFMRVGNDPSTWPWTIEWINSSIQGLLMGGAMLTALFLQYKHRSTKVSRVLLIAAFAVSQFAYWMLPPSLGLAIQAALPIDSNAEAARLSAVDVRFYKPEQPVGEEFPRPANIRQVHIGIHGPANDEEGMLDGFRIALEADDGRVWTSPWKFGPNPWQALSEYAGGFDEWVAIDPAFLEAERNNSVTLRATIYATVLGDVQPPFQLAVSPRNAYDTFTLYSKAHYIDAGSGFQCAAVPASAPNDPFRPAVILCRTPLSWPAVALTVDRVSNNGDTLRNAFESRNMSYSPFPLTGERVTAVRTAQGEPRNYQDEAEYNASFVTLSLEDHVIVHMRKPIAHFKREIVQRVRLDEPGPQRQPANSK